MSDLFNFSTDGPYEHRTQSLINNNVAVWDVIQACFRSGSLDASIDEKTIVANNFEGLFSECPEIGAVFFNGKKAQQAYMKYVIPALSKKNCELNLYLLPSTSPAYAAMSYADKYQKWKIIQKYL